MLLIFIIILMCPLISAAVCGHEYKRAVKKETIIINNKIEQLVGAKLIGQLYTFTALPGVLVR